MPNRFSRDATLTNGRYELPRHARGVLVLADPPEAGWRIESNATQDQDSCGHPRDDGDPGAVWQRAFERTPTAGATQ
jgi:hypothetical protein